MGGDGRLQGSEDDDGFVVEMGGAGLEIGDGLKDDVYRGLRGGVVLRFEKFGETLVAEHVAGGVYGVDDAVGEEDDEVAWPGGEGELFVFSVGKEAEREAFGLNGSDGGGLGRVGVDGDEEGLDRAGVGDLEGLVAVVPGGHEHGDVLGVELALLQLVVKSCEHLCG